MIPANKFLALPPHEITPEAEEEFFTSLRLRNGTYKTTFQKRFAEINHALLQFFQSGDIAVGNILDIGISSGSNTLELYQELESAGCESRMVGTDMMPDAWLVHVFPGCFALVDDTGYPLRYDVFNLSMKPWVTRQDYRSGFFIFRKGINLLFGYRAKQIMQESDSAAVRKVELVTPRLREYRDIIVQKDDITKYNRHFEGGFTFIRAANVLNKGYFSRENLASIIGNVKRYLTKPQAALLVVRTHENGVNHGTLFTVDTDRGCNILRRFGRGSEIEDIVLERMRMS